MNGWAITLIVWMSIGSLVMFARVGKPRKPVTLADAYGGLFFTAVFILFIVLAVQH